MNQLAIAARGLRKAYGSHVVLDGVDLEVAEGTVFGLLGPNGAGKTTMVRILSTLIPADAGDVRVAGHDLTREPDLVRAAIGVTGQFSAVDGLLTGEENLMLMADLRHLDRRAGRRRAAELLEQFDLADAAKKPARTYSGGMRRRLDLAMTLVGEPRVIFLDEPTTGLDPRSRRAMWDIDARQLVADGVTVLLTTQYLEEADQLADRIALLDQRPDRRRGHRRRAQAARPRRARSCSGSPTQSTLDARARALREADASTTTPSPCRCRATAASSRCARCSDRLDADRRRGRPTCPCTRPTSTTSSSPSPTARKRSEPSHDHPDVTAAPRHRARCSSATCATCSGTRRMTLMLIGMPGRLPAAVRLRLRRHARRRAGRSRPAGAPTTPTTSSRAFCLITIAGVAQGTLDRGGDGHDRGDHRAVPHDGHLPGRPC